MGKKTKRLRRQLANALARLGNAKAYSRGMLTTAAAHEREAEVLRPLAAYERDLESSMEDLQEAVGRLPINSWEVDTRSIRRAVGRLMEALDRRKKEGPPEPPPPLRFVVEAQPPKEAPTAKSLFLQVIRSEEGRGETLEILGRFVGVERGPAPSDSSAWAEEDGPYKERIIRAVLRWEGEPTDWERMVGRTHRTPARSAPSPSETLATIQAAKAESFGCRYEGPTLETASGADLDHLAKYVGFTRRTQTLGAYTEGDAHLRSRIILEVRERAYGGKPLELPNPWKGKTREEIEAELNGMIGELVTLDTETLEIKPGVAPPVCRWPASELDAHFQAKPLSMEEAQEAHETLHPSGVTSLGPHPMSQDFMDRLKGCGHLWHLVHPGHQGPCPGCGAA